MMRKKLWPVNLTSPFETLRTEARERRQRFDPGTNETRISIDGKEYLKGIQHQIADNELKIGLLAAEERSYGATARWMEDYDVCQVFLQRMDESVHRQKWLLNKSRSLLVGDGGTGYTEELMSIGNLVNGLMSDVNKTLANIYTEQLSQASETIDPLELRMRYNAARGITMDLRRLSREYRHLHHKLVEEHMKYQKENNAALTQDQHTSEVNSAYSPPSMLRQFLPKQPLVSTQQIEHVQRLMEHVCYLFEETNKLTLEQGSMLDRIDANIDHAVARSLQGKKQVRLAEHKQRHGLAKQVSVVLIITNAVMVQPPTYPHQHRHVFLSVTRF
ncbi:putative syntaxin [Gregarina niphandrodes]|uniref:Syntaxin n=1 Tax=Gregarina niphandrodes TaxID=110365 RepID=A0A023BC58_GRENI|nr:putative syntaxin [Gregarina niphandrodes]EZG82154.1 putative syntaxin [Gregarina niphandrodes]|eukprot:XP_011129024.1 putative syntaxin [Gregarina niphandrodes]